MTETALVAAGDFTGPGSAAHGGSAVWNGAEWESLGDGVGPGVETLAVYDDDGPGPHPPCIYAGGYMRQASGYQFDYIARWNGASWAGLPPGPNDRIFALAAFDDGTGHPLLFVGGFFDSVSGSPASGLATWDGSAWHAVVLPGASGLRADITGLATFDPDGSGPTRPVLLASGRFALNGVERTLAQWDGVSWTPVADDPSWRYAFASVDEDGWAGLPPALYAVGSFDTAGGHSSANIARLGCEPCYANCDASTTPPILTVADFTCFLNRFAAGDPYANCDRSTTTPVLNVADFTCFLNRFAAGCP